MNNWDINDYRVDYSKEDIIQIVDLLKQGKVIGVANNLGETGPRALGNRSILALANSKEIAKKVSEYHKKREWYRPVAPIMLEKNAKYFTGLKEIHHLSKFMLLDFKVLEAKKKEIEGAVHVDGTSRMQVVFSRQDNPYVFDLLTELNDNHSIKALINTSFNLKGEPIVHTIEGALRSAKNMDLDAVVLNGKLQIIK